MIYITFDTERDWYKTLGLNTKAYTTKKFEMIERAIPRLVEIAEEYSIPYTYFICGEVAENVSYLFEGLTGHSIGVHTHPFTHTDIFKGNNDNDYENDKIENYVYDEQLKMIFEDKEKIKDNIGIESNIFRAGKHSANLTTFRVLEQLKFKIDCSIYMGYQLLGWSPFKFKNTNLLELPAYCDASPEAINVVNILLNYSSIFEKFGLGHYVIVMHPMIFGNTLIDTDKMFLNYEMFISNLIKKGYNFSSIDASMPKCHNLYNLIGKGITTLCHPIYRLLNKPISQKLLVRL